MDAIVLGMLVLVSATDASHAPATQRAAIAPVAFSYEVPESSSSDRAGVLPTRFERTRAPVRESTRAAQATSATRSRTDRIIAIAAGASLGFVLGGRIGYAVTPKRGPYDDTSGLKGVLIGAPVGAVVGALIGHRLTR
jgi:hypothetical protein